MPRPKKKQTTLAVTVEPVVVREPVSLDAYFDALFALTTRAMLNADPVTARAA
jgi:hypothetical protein